MVSCKPPFGGPEYVLQYLGRYTHRVAITNHRPVSFTDGQVTFHGGTPLTTTNRSCCRYRSTSLCLSASLHILPQGFVRIRHFRLAGQPVAAPRFCRFAFSC